MGIQNTLKALADPTRREILTRLKESRQSAGEIAAHFTMSAPAVSKHLNILKEAELIRDCREGKYIYYELNASVLEEVMLWIASLKGEEDDESEKGVSDPAVADVFVDPEHQCPAGFVT